MIPFRDGDALPETWGLVVETRVRCAGFVDRSCQISIIGLLSIEHRRTRLCWRLVRANENLILHEAPCEPSSFSASNLQVLGS